LAAKPVEISTVAGAVERSGANRPRRGGFAGQRPSELSRWSLFSEGIGELIGFLPINGLGETRGRFLFPKGRDLVASSRPVMVF